MSDENYIIDLIDLELRCEASRQHRFPFLRGDKGKNGKIGRMLPVDAYYPTLKLVIEYREKQHTESVKHFDKRDTVSGVKRGEQRKIYDQRRRNILPQHGIRLIEFSYFDFDHYSNKRLKRNLEKDLVVIRKKLFET